MNFEDKSVLLSGAVVVVVDVAPGVTVLGCVSVTANANAESSSGRKDKKIVALVNGVILLICQSRQLLVIEGISHQT